MSRTRLKIPPEFEEASIQDQIAFVQALWDRIAEHCDDVPVSDEHRAILRARLEAYRANPEGSVAWRDLRESLLAQIRSS